MKRLANGRPLCYNATRSKKTRGLISGMVPIGLNPERTSAEEKTMEVLK